MRIHIQSFGFKYGVPGEADLVMDVRFLTNPYSDPELRELDGRDGSVVGFMEKDPHLVAFLERYLGLLDFLIPLYEAAGRSDLTVAVGCTGGRHRSVMVAEAVYGHLNNGAGEVGLAHRDVRRL